MLFKHTTHTTAYLALKAVFKGEIITPDDIRYEDARRIWNGMIDKHPALIVRPLDTDDVRLAIQFAQESGLPLAVRGGGHNVAGHAVNDGGIVIDLVAMKQISVDPVKRVARAEGGVTWGELDAASQAFGLATPGGVFSKTGIAGLTLGGGFGWLRNKYGLSCDNLISAELVTASGEVIYTSKIEHPELLWGLRGGGGNFGVVTTFEFQLHPIGPDVMMAFVFHDANTQERMKTAIRFYRDYVAVAPDEVSTIMALGQFPEDAHFPESLHNQRFALIAAVYAGPVDEGKNTLQPISNFSTPLLDLSGVKPYIEAQQMFDADYPDGLRYYWKSLNLLELSEEAIECIAQHAWQQASPYSTTDLWHIGGAVTRSDETVSAFFGRKSAFMLNLEANWVDAADDASNLAWVGQFIKAAQPFSDGSRYLNFPGFQEEGDAMIRDSFGPHYQRLVALKRQYDPNNLFRLNQNIRPE